VTQDVLRDVLADARRIGLLGERPVEDHIRHAEVWAAALEPGDFLDLGSGAGVPGLVLATVWPDVRGALLDGQVRRTAWLRTAVVRLGYGDRVGVVEGRAEELAHDPDLRERFPVVVARGFGPPATTAECGAGFAARGGVVSVSEPPMPDDSRWSPTGLAELGLVVEREVVQDEASFVILRKRDSLGPGRPRRRNLPLRRPLW
jgi:16S rRNA (guanine527-N7)-methyltransferase